MALVQEQEIFLQMEYDSLPKEEKQKERANEKKRLSKWKIIPFAGERLRDLGVQV